MFSFNFFKRFRRKPKTVETIFVPTEILEMSWMYPVLRDLIGNKANGEIRKFNNDREKKIGQGLILNGEKEVWVYLGQNYFKNIVKL